MKQKRRTPLPALVVMALACAMLVPLLWVSDEEDAVRTEPATATWLPGGETVSSSRPSSVVCKDAPVVFSTGTVERRETAFVHGSECLTEGSQEITVRYDPDDPSDVSTQERAAWFLWPATAGATIGFLLAVGGIVRQLVERRRGRREQAAAGGADAPLADR